MPWRRKWKPTPVFMLGKSHEQKEPGILGVQSMGLQKSQTQRSNPATTTLIREMQIKTTIRCHLLEWLLGERQEITSVVKDEGKGEHLGTILGNINRCSHLKISLKFDKK